MVGRHCFTIRVSFVLYLHAAVYQLLLWFPSWLVVRVRSRSASPVLRGHRGLQGKPFKFCEHAVPARMRKQYRELKARVGRLRERPQTVLPSALLTARDTRRSVLMNCCI